MNLRSQLLKGVLEGCILAIIQEEPTYGYGLSKELHERGLENISEGSIYPILLRLQREEIIKGEMRPSPAGPRRKYYELTKKGEEALSHFKREWDNIKKPVDRLMNSGGDCQ